MLAQSEKHVCLASHSTYVSVKEKRLTYFSGPILHSFFLVFPIFSFFDLLMYIYVHAHTHTHQLDVPDLHLNIAMTYPQVEFMLAR